MVSIGIAEPSGSLAPSVSKGIAPRANLHAVRATAAVTSSGRAGGGLGGGALSHAQSDPSPSADDITHGIDRDPTRAIVPDYSWATRAGKYPSPVGRCTL